MRSFRVNMEGHGFSLPMGGSASRDQGDANTGNCAIGFFTSRTVWASDASHAIQKAINRIEKEWTRYSGLQGYEGKLEIRIKTVEELTLWGSIVEKRSPGLV